MMEKLKIVIADDSNEFVTKLCGFFEKKQEVEVVYTCNDGSFLLKYLRNNVCEIFFIIFSLLKADITIILPGCI